MKTMFKKNYNQCIHNPYNNKIILKHILWGFVCFDTGSGYVALEGLELRDLPVPAGINHVGPPHPATHFFIFKNVPENFILEMFAEQRGVQTSHFTEGAVPADT